MDHKSKSVSAPKTSRRGKSARQRPKGKAQESIKTLEKECKTNIDKVSKSKNTEPRTVRKIKRTYERKPSQCLPAVPAEDSASETSCCSLANGGEGSTRLLCPGQVESKEPGSETESGKNAIAKKRRKVGRSTRTSRQSFPKNVKQSVTGQIQKAQKADESREQKTKTPVHEKEAAHYTSGSQEEMWNLQIADKGHVTCPRCKTASRKTVDGLKKHMTNCKMNPFTCQHCGKQLKSATGMKYHIMADHNELTTSEEANKQDNQSLKENLRKVLKRMGKLKCSKEGCSASFTSVMGYLYHTRKCGKEESELEKLVLNCRHCGKAYRSRAGLEYHLKSEHGPQSPAKVTDDEDGTTPNIELDPERTPSGRVKRISAQVAIFHLQEIASEELLKEWPKRKVQQDLVPDDKKLKYARPGLPAFSQEVLRKWKNEVKLQRKVQCPNQGCDSVYTSVSGLKAHLGLCSRGDFEAGKYKCLICDKEFSSESGVKYHINSIHAQDWFIVSSKASKSFEKLLKRKPKEKSAKASSSQSPSLRFTPEPKGWPERGPPVDPTAVLQAKPGAAGGDGKVKEVPSSREKDCYEFSGSDSPSSSSSSSSSSSESDADEPPAPKHDKWALKRPVTRHDATKRAKTIT